MSGDLVNAEQLRLARRFPADQRMLVIYNGPSGPTQAWHYVLCLTHAEKYAKQEQEYTSVEHPITIMMFKCEPHMNFCQKCYSDFIRGGAGKQLMSPMGQTPWRNHTAIPSHA